MEASRLQLVLVRHGETEWSRDGRHTGRSDIALTADGRAEARTAGEKLGGIEFTRVLTSPLSRAVETCRIAGLGDRAETREELLEWDYGEYEGLTSARVHETRPDWVLWRDGCPGGESPGDVGGRADALLAELGADTGTVAIFAHGHVLRVLAARWLDFKPAAGARFALGTATVSLLGWEHDWRTIRRWNT